MALGQIINNTDYVLTENRTLLLIYFQSINDAVSN
jgi:hypothetical protein